MIFFCILLHPHYCVGSYFWFSVGPFRFGTGTRDHRDKSDWSEYVTPEMRMFCWLPCSWENTDLRPLPPVPQCVCVGVSISLFLTLSVLVFFLAECVFLCLSLVPLFSSSVLTVCVWSCSPSWRCVPVRAEKPPETSPLTQEVFTFPVWPREWSTPTAYSRSSTVMSRATQSHAALSHVREGPINSHNNNNTVINQYMLTKRGVKLWINRDSVWFTIYELAIWPAKDFSFSFQFKNY